MASEALDERELGMAQNRAADTPRRKTLLPGLPEMTAPTTRETADHAELARLRQHIANLKLRPGHHVQFGTPSVSQISNYWNRDLAADLEALLSEIAALRGLLDERDLEIAEDDAAMRDLDAQIEDANDRATQAERQRDELRKALEPFAEAAESLDDETSDHDHIWEQLAAMSIDAGHLRTARALIANQGAE